LNQRPLGYEGNGGGDGRQLPPTGPKGNWRLQRIRLVWVGAGWQGFTDRTRTIRRRKTIESSCISQFQTIRAGDRNRTGDVQLGNFHMTMSRNVTSYQNSSLPATRSVPVSHDLSLLLTQFGQHLGQRAPPVASCRHHSYVPRADGALDRTGLPAIVLWSIPARLSQRTPVHEPPRTPSPCR
jgi:hypothetical protein